MPYSAGDRCNDAIWGGGTTKATTTTTKAPTTTTKATTTTGPGDDGDTKDGSGAGATGEGEAGAGAAWVRADGIATVLLIMPFLLN